MSIVTKKDSTLIAGVGSALVDILLQEDDLFLESTKSEKGGMTLVDPSVIDGITTLTDKELNEVPGGSACNTIIGVGKLAGKSKFIGKRGNDSLGELFENSLKENNVEPVLATSDTPTGRVLSIITPDAQRTLFTYLGASGETDPKTITADLFKDVAIVHLEGYLLFNEDLIFAALDAAKQAGALISLDLAAFTVVEASRHILDKIVKEYVDIILANEDEAKAFTGEEDEEKSLQILAEHTTVAVLKVGKRGSWISHAGKTYSVSIPKPNGPIVDTTGAGDLWASGFLYGLVEGFPIDKCGEIASACGTEVCQVIGAHIPEEGWNRIKEVIKK